MTLIWMPFAALKMPGRAATEPRQLRRARAEQARRVNVCDAGILWMFELG
jgi:hypothetical protein